MPPVGTRTVRVEGAAELGAKLRALPDGLSRQIVTAALLAGAEPVRAAAEGKAPHEPGAPDLRANIVTNATDWVGSERGGRGRPRTATEFVVDIGAALPFFYALFQEYGVQPHWIEEEGFEGEIFHPGHAAQPFMRPAFDTQGDEALRIAMEQLWAAIARLAESGGTP